MFARKNIGACLLVFIACSVDVLSKHFVLISAPGSGKGTFSQYMVKKYGYVHIGVGDICRQRMASNVSVEPEILTKIVKKRMIAAIENNQQFILDNAIASEDMYRYWKSFFEKRNIVNDVCFIELQASDQTCINRIKHRLICRNCCNVCKDTVVNKRCDQCGSNLSKRDEDVDQKFLKKRFQRYHQTINPILKEIAQSFRLITISSEQPLPILYSIYDQLSDL